MVKIGRRVNDAVLGEMITIVGVFSVWRISLRKSYHIDKSICPAKVLQKEEAALKAASLF